MEENVFPVGNNPFSVPSMDSAMGIDFIDELLFHGCWLETADGSEFINTSPSTSISPFDPSSFMWSPTMETGIWNSSLSLPQICNQDVVERSGLEEVHGRDLMNVNRRWWIGPRANPTGPGNSVMERLVNALRHIKEDIVRDGGSLIQIWVPVNRSGRRFLATNEQPFALDSICQRLVSYREISVNYQFLAEEEEHMKDFEGLPGRVFLRETPEWTPDVRFFRSEEYPRVHHAQNLDVRGTLAVPVFEQGSKHCLGVIEVVTTSRMVKSRPELESISKALKAVNLRSMEVPIPPRVRARDLSYRAALPEIQNLLRCACETHKLPLAQTWVSCLQQGKGGCRHTHENYIHCISTVDEACHIGDPNIREFHEACSEHHLLKGEGVAGKAFLTNEPCFSPDIANDKKTDYPLSHHATLFGLHGAVAIRLRCIHTGTADFVLEFFLPKNCRDLEEQRKMLNSLSTIMAHVPVSLRIVTEKELEEETDSLTSEVIEREETLLNKSEMNHLQEPSEVQQSNNPQKIGLVFDEGEKQNNDFDMERGFEYCGDSSMKFSSTGLSRMSEKRRTKAEKNITLDVLRQYFAGSLKDAAKNIGVCPTTLKRICRQHGIQRWPSRKIKKVGHSLQKIQRVIDSVQGVSGPLPIDSFYTSFSDLTSPKQLQSKLLLPSKTAEDYMNPVVLQPESCVKSPSSSCSQSSTSSQCYSSETQPVTSSLIHKSGIVEYPGVGDNSLVDGSLLKKTRSKAELHFSSLEETKILPRSHSRKSFAERDPLSENLPQFPETHTKEDDFLRIKVTYQDDKIRFRLQNPFRFKDLLWEISKRFNIDNINGFDVKYLDDENEWVLLTCDADLEECIDVYRSSPTSTIKLLLQASCHHFPERSSASGCPS